MITRRAFFRGTAGVAAGLALTSVARGQSYWPGIPNVGVKADTGPARSESGVGALMPWADVLWAVTYNSHKARTGTGLGLYEIDEKLSIRLRHTSNGTFANRLVHKPSNQIIIGPYVVDMAGKFRVIEPLLDHRLTATMPHLTDPANRVHILTMEGLFFEMDVSTLKCTPLADLVKELNIHKPPHFKGGFTGQGRVVVANNTYTAWNESEGMLAEWDGKRWKIVHRKPYMEVAGRTNMGGVVFATGWDESSAILQALIDGQWKRYRLPKASHTFDQYWQTEWTRIREVETERFLMDCHGMFYELSPMAFEKSIWGVRPICTHLRIIPDFCAFRGLFVLAGNQTTPNGDANPVGGQPQAGIWFGKTDDLWQWGKPKGWGGPWRAAAVRAGDASDPFLMTGFEKKVLHLTADKAVTFTVEIDFLGTESWQLFERIKFAAAGYRYHVFPEGFSAHWVRITADADCTATAEFVYT